MEMFSVLFAFVFVFIYVFFFLFVCIIIIVLCQINLINTNTMRIHIHVFNVVLIVFEYIMSVWMSVCLGVYVALSVITDQHTHSVIYNTRMHC